MRVELKKEGGIASIPALSRPVSVETADLEPAEAERLTSLVRGANFFDLPGLVGTPPGPGAADYQTYTITVDDGGRTHTVRVSEPIENEPLAELVSFVSRRPKR